MSWWGSNPFDEVVEEATSELLPGGQENLALNLDISDRIRSKKVNAKDAMQSLKKRLAHKNPNVQLATLSLLDTCVKNSGDIFISQVAKREFMDALVDIVKSPTCNLDVKTKLLGIIKTWGMASRNRPNICYIYDTYVLLRAEGMLFPASTENLDGIFFETAAAPEWSDSDVCERCRTAFTLTNRKLGINEAVRVCDGCYIKVKLENAGNRTTQPVAVEAPKPTTNNSEFDNDIEKAIALSLKEAEQQKNNSGFVQSMPKEETPVMEEDPDLAAAIAASLNDLNISKEEPKSDEITSSEIENILLFHTLMDRIAMAGGNASNDPQVNELYNQIGALHPKLIKNVDETIRKRNMFIELHQKLNTVVKTYDRVLEERISQHQPTYHPPPSYNPQDQYYHGYHQPPDQRYSPIPAQPVEKVDDAPLIEL